MQQIIKGDTLSLITRKFVSSVKTASIGLDEKTDLNEILKSIPHVKLHEGYSLGAYRVGDMMGDHVVLYPFRTGSTDVYDPGEPNRDIEHKAFFDIDRYYDKAQKGDEEAKKTLELIHNPIPFRDGQVVRSSILWCADESIPQLKDYLDIDFTPESIWESLLLLVLSSNYLPHRWHGCYANGVIVLYYISLRKASEYSFSHGGIDWKPFKSDDRLLPSVKMIDESQATVNVCRWNSWRGLDRLTYNAFREGRTIRFEREDPDNIIKYNCGIHF